MKLTRKTSVLLTAALILFSTRGPHSLLVGQASRPRLPAVGYYIAVRATLQYDGLVYVLGNSNLPKGSILEVNIYDFLGTGNHRVSQDTTAAIGEDGLFAVGVHPATGFKFKSNMVCDVIFGPGFPPQSKEILRIVGKHGENLGSEATNPQIEIGSAGALLAAVTVVHN